MFKCDAIVSILSIWLTYRFRVTVSALFSLVGPAHQLLLPLAASKCDVFSANKIWFDWFKSDSVLCVDRRKESSWRTPRKTVSCVILHSSDTMYAFYRVELFMKTSEYCCLVLLHRPIFCNSPPFSLLNFWFKCTIISCLFLCVFTNFLKGYVLLSNLNTAENLLKSRPTKVYFV